MSMAYVKLPGQIDPPLEIFGGTGSTPEFKRHQRLLEIESAFLHCAMARATQLKEVGAIRQIRDGLIQRHLMMDTSRIFIRENCLKQEGELDPYLASELDVHLNAFYLNLSGGLDNLAWAVAYERALLSTIDEESRDCRRFCQLAGKKFLEALIRVESKAAALLKSQRDWILEVKELRDPAAHRLPLRFVTGILFEDKREEYERLKEEADVALKRGDVRRRMELKLKQKNLMNFMPFLASPAPDEKGIRVITNLVNADQEQFLAIARFVLDYVLIPSAA